MKHKSQFESNRTRKATKNRPSDNTVKNPDNWITGDEDPTGAQTSYLNTLASEAGEEINVEDLTKAEASKKIDELQHKTGRGLDS